MNGFKRIYRAVRVMFVDKCIISGYPLSSWRMEIFDFGKDEQEIQILENKENE